MDRAYEVPLRLDDEIREIAIHTPRPEPLSQAQREQIIIRIKRLLEEKNAVVVAHYYVDEQLQILADATGGHVDDSLGMADFGCRHPASTLVVTGVRFMGETAKILNPEKRVLMPDLDATCSLDLGCPPDEFSAYCDQYPERTVVVYANTSAAVKARADWMVTSSNAVEIIQHLEQRGETFIWAPDKHLGRYIEQQTGADMLRWQGACVVHDEFKHKELRELMEEYPEAEVLVHPESPEGVIELADVVGSTSKIINAARTSKADTFIVATDYGLFHKMKEAAPGKRFLVAPTGGTSPSCSMCAHCPWMAMNGLQNLADTLETGENEIHVDEEIRQKALIPIQRMLDFSREHGLVASVT